MAAKTYLPFPVAGGLPHREGQPAPFGEAGNGGEEESNEGAERTGGQT